MQCKRSSVRRARPFTSLVWLPADIEGEYLVDRLLSGSDYKGWVGAVIKCWETAKRFLPVGEK